MAMGQTDGWAAAVLGVNHFGVGAFFYLLDKNNIDAGLSLNC